MRMKKTVRKFLRSREAKNCTPKTIDWYRWRLDKFRKWAKEHGIKSVEEFTPDDLDDWVVSLYRQKWRWRDHPIRPACKGKLSPSTIAGCIQAVKTFFNWSAERGHVNRSPALYLVKPDEELDASERLMSYDDLQAMLNKACELAETGERLAIRDLAIIAFAGDTGCRPGEIRNLRLCWLNLEKLEATVKGKRGERGRRRKRTVLFTEKTAETLVNWLKVRPDRSSNRVFVNRSGKTLTENGLYQIFKRLAKKAGVTGRYNPHAVRHWVGQTYTDDTNLELARDKLGHTTVVTTANSYAHQDRDHVRTATERLSPWNHRERDN